MSIKVAPCPIHPDAEPVMVTVNKTYSHQTKYSTRIVQEPRCPQCIR